MCETRDLRIKWPHWHTLIFECYGEVKGNALIRKLAMRICGSKIWEELHLLISKQILVEVEHVKAHRTKKDKHEMTHFEKFVTDGNEKADELAKAREMLDEGFMAEAGAKRVQQEREEVFAALQYAARCHYLVEAWKAVKRSSRSQEKSEFSWTSKKKKRNIERSGVPRPTRIDV